MNRRRAIIASLLGLVPAFSQDKSTWLYVKIPDHMEGPGLCRSNGDGQTCTLDQVDQPIDYAMTIQYKGRVVRLTGDEIMDALEGKA